MDVKEIKRILELLNGACCETNCADCEYRNKGIGRPYTCKLDEEEALSEAVRIIEEQEERIAIMSEGGWIPVEKRLPEKKETVLLADKYEICFGYLTDYEDFRAVDDCLKEDNRPARQKYPCSCYEYWMHLPELPKGWALDDEPPKEGDQ